MKMTINNGMMLRELMIKCSRDYYSPAGYDALLGCYDEINPDMELDPVAICCDCTEYGEDVTCSIADMFADYGYLVEDEYEDNDDRLAALVDALEHETTVLELDNGNYIVFSF